MSKQASIDQATKVGLSAGKLVFLVETDHQGTNRPSWLTVPDAKTKENHTNPTRFGLDAAWIRQSLAKSFLNVARFGVNPAIFRLGPAISCLPSHHLYPRL